MKHLVKIFAFIMFFSSTLGLAQVTETVKEDTKEKTKKVYKAEDDKRVLIIGKEEMTPELAAKQKMTALDADKDGKISLEEASTSEKFSKHFGKIDTNGDSFIDMDELKVKMSKSKDKEKSKAKPDY